MAQYSDLDPTRLKASLSDGTDLKPSITTSGYAGGTPAAVTDLKPSICYADGTLKQSIADDTDIKPGLLIAGAARGNPYTTAGVADTNIARHLRGENGNGNDPGDDGYYLDSATLAGGVTTTTVQSYFGTGSIEFDGTDDLVTFTGSNELESTSSDCTTWEMWFRPETLSSNRGLWSMVNGTDYIHAYIDGSGSVAVAAVLGIPRFSIITAPGTVTANTWHFFRLVRNLTTFELFVDGVSMGTQTDSNTYGGTGWDLNIGQGYSTGFFDGQIDEFLILDQVCMGAGKPTSAITPATSYKYQETGDLFLWWKFDEGSGTSVADSSGNARTGTLTNTTGDWATGKVGDYAVDLDGAAYPNNDYVNLANSSFPSQFTATAWVKFDVASASTNESIWAKYDNSPTSDASWLLRWDHTTTRITSAIFQNSSTYIGRQATGQTASAGTWYHVALTYDGGTSKSGIKIYLDGVQVDNLDSGAGSFSSFNNTSPEPVRMGAYSASGTVNQGVMDGKVDDARIYERVLNASEILALYNENA